MGSDFYPTLLSLTGLPMRSDQHKDGIDLSPALQGKAMAERPLIWHYPHYGNQGGRPSSIIRLGQWKLIHYYEENTQVLYDLEKDMEEQNDLADEYPEVKEQLHQQLFEYLKLVNARFPEQDPFYNATEEEAYLSKIKHQKLPQLEQKRMNILSPDFDAGDWWGSQVIND